MRYLKHACVYENILQIYLLCCESMCIKLVIWALQRLLARPSNVYVYIIAIILFQKHTFFPVEYNLFAGSGCVTVVNFVKPYYCVCVRLFVCHVLVRVPLSACKLFAYFLAPLNADTCICLHVDYSDNVQQNKKRSTGQGVILLCFFVLFCIFVPVYSIYCSTFCVFTPLTHLQVLLFLLFINNISLLLFKHFVAGGSLASS